MNKTMKLKSIIGIALFFILLAVTACSSGSGIIGELSYTSQRTSLDVTANFEQNELLSQSTTKVSVRIYESDETYKSVQTASVTNNIAANVTFSSLTANTSYILKLFVSVDGVEEELDSIVAATESAGLSAENAIEITTVAEFKAMANDRDAYYKLTADIDFVDAGELNLFTSESNAFEGSFDGNGHTLKNITLSAKTYSGIFEYTNGATISNLKLENVSLSNSSTSVNHAGALIGMMKDTTISDISVNGVTMSFTTTTTTSNLNIGSLVGSTDKTSSITNCTVENAKLDITRVRTTKTFTLGLLVGNLTGDTGITNSSAKGTIFAGLQGSGTYYIGGFAGAVSSIGQIEHCYTDVTISTNRVAATTTSATGTSSLSIGGFVGGNFGSNHLNMNDCLAIADISAMSIAQETDQSIDAWKEAAAKERLAYKVYVGGLVGSANRTSYGIKNCVYAAKDFGIRVATSLADTDNKEDVITYSPDVKIALTIARNTITTIAGRIENVYALENVISFDFTATTLSTVTDGEEGSEEEKDETTDVTEPAELTAIREKIVTVTDQILDNAASNLSVALQAILEDRA